MDKHERKGAGRGKMKQQLNAKFEVVNLKALHEGTEHLSKHTGHLPTHPNPYVPYLKEKNVEAN